MSITNEQLVAMRASGQITDQEIAIVEGDLIVAKNVVTEARRIIGKVGDILVESTKRQVLKGEIHSAGKTDLRGIYRRGFPATFRGWSSPAPARQRRFHADCRVA